MHNEVLLKWIVCCCHVKTWFAFQILNLISCHTSCSCTEKQLSKFSLKPWHINVLFLQSFLYQNVLWKYPHVSLSSGPKTLQHLFQTQERAPTMERSLCPAEAHYPFCESWKKLIKMTTVGSFKSFSRNALIHWNGWGLGFCLSRASEAFPLTGLFWRSFLWPLGHYCQCEEFM